MTSKTVNEYKKKKKTSKKDFLNNTNYYATYEKIF